MNNTQNVSLKIFKTQVLDYNNFIDLSEINGVVRTQWFTKESEPNNFRLLEDLEGDCFDEMVNRGLNV